MLNRQIYPGLSLSLTFSLSPWGPYTKKERTPSQRNQLLTKLLALQYELFVKIPFIKCYFELTLDEGKPYKTVISIAEIII